MTGGSWNDLEMVTDYDGNIWCAEHNDWQLFTPLYQGGEYSEPFILIDLKIAVIRHMQQWHKGETL